MDNLSKQILAEKEEEYIMVFPTELLSGIGYFQGLSLETNKYLNVILNEKNYKFIRRKDAEVDPHYKQLIPYVILRYGETIFAYRRGKLLAEERLLGNYSIGIGGHISVHDTNWFGTTYEEGVRREVNEEIKIDSKYKEEIVALINDDSNEVGKVHFGVIHIFTLDSPAIRAKEKSINEAKFLNLLKLKKDIQKFENWSKICIQEFGKLLPSQSSV